MMKGGMAGLMKQAQQMQANMKKAQDELATMEVEGQSGSGMVKVTMTCTHDVRRVTLDASVMDDKEMLEDLIVAALQDANKKAGETSKKRMSGFAASLPPGMGLPF
jgi:DNA-binding YbaB/EbfC family protein